MSNNKIVSFNDEKLICVDQHDNVIGHKTKSEIHKTGGVLHRAFSIFIFLDSGEVLLQKRSQQKKLWPCYWSNSCCSHPRKGEKYFQAAHRRLQDELGIDTELTHKFKFIYTAHYTNIGTEKELCSVFTGKISDPNEIQFNKNEIEKCDWVSPDLIDEMILHNPGQFTPWFLSEWSFLKRRSDTDLQQNKVAC